MTRRTAVRNATLMMFAMALGKMDVLKAQNGRLTVNLDQWDGITFSHRGKSITVPVEEVFAALRPQPSQLKDCGTCGDER